VLEISVNWDFKNKPGGEGERNKLSNIFVFVFVNLS
jgi:hypothetical protein